MKKELDIIPTLLFLNFHNEKKTAPKKKLE